MLRKRCYFFFVFEAMQYLYIVILLMQTFYLLHEEGFFVGASSGLNVAAAVKVSTLPEECN